MTDKLRLSFNKISSRLVGKKLNPVLLASTGRSGSTLLMHVLSLHDQIVVRQIFPYETRAAQYYYACGQEGQHYPSFSPVTFRGIEYRPFPDSDTQSVVWSKNHVRTPVGQSGGPLTGSYYHYVAGIEKKPLAKYFAEKCIGLETLEMMMADFDDAKAIFLIRDPRDIFFSIKSFNHKRGFLHFGEERGDEFMYAQIIRHHLNADNLTRRLKERALEVRYENLIGNDSRTLSNLFESLGLDNSGDQIRRILATAFLENDEVKNHKTTNEGRESVGRWRKETDQEFFDLFEQYQDELHELGYR